MGFFKNLLGKSGGGTYDTYETLLSAEVKNLTLKNIALETCANYVARSFSKGEVVFEQEGKRSKDDLAYLLNVRPNPNQTASEFKAELAKRLVENGEVLVIQDKGSLYIANSFNPNYSVKGNSFSNVSVKNDDQYFADKVYLQGNNCFYLASENEGLKQFIENLWLDYGQVFGSLFATQRMSGQIRAKWAMPDKHALDDKAREINKQIRENIASDIDSGKRVVMIPNSDQVKYEEITSDGSTKSVNQIDDMTKMKQSYINDVADILGIPNALLHGDMANNSENWDLFVEAVLEPMANRLSEALAHLYIKKSGYLVGKSVSMRGFKDLDIFKRSDAIDRLGASGLFTKDEIRNRLGFEDLPNGAGQVVVMTKNYQKEDKV